MSRIWKQIVPIPAGVTAAINGSSITITGPKGSLAQTFLPFVSLSQEANALVVAVEKPLEKLQRGVWWLTRAIIVNMIEGVVNGYKKSLEIQWVGYRFELNGPSKLTLSVGFSHKVVLAAPKGVTITPDEKEKSIIHISGIDKQQVWYFAALVRSTKVPEPYKGKGIRFVGEHVKRKAGKTAGA